MPKTSFRPSACVFAKYRVNGQAWRHASLSPSGTLAPPGAQVDENAVVDIQVFAIEMVYVPEGPFRGGRTAQ